MLKNDYSLVVESQKGFLLLVIHEKSLMIHHIKCRVVKLSSNRGKKIRTCTSIYTSKIGCKCSLHSNFGAISCVKHGGEGFSLSNPLLFSKCSVVNSMNQRNFLCTLIKMTQTFLNNTVSLVLPQDVSSRAYKVTSISYNDTVIGHNVLQIEQQLQWVQLLL